VNIPFFRKTANNTTIASKRLYYTLKERTLVLQREFKNCLASQDFFNFFFLAEQIFELAEHI